MLRQEIAKLIEKSIKELQKTKKLPKFDRTEGGWRPEIQIEHPEEKIHGDYATNVAMVVAKQLKKSPTEIATLLNSELNPPAGGPKPKLFEKIEVAKPGFINFFLSKEYLQKQVREILKEKEKFGQLKIGKNKKVNIEFCSANPTGPLHLGHGRGAFWGDTLSNIFEKAGYKVTREYFINDYGKQILLLGKSIETRYRESLGQKVEISEDFYRGGYIKDIAGEIIKQDKDKYLKLSEEERVRVFTKIGSKKMFDEAKKLLERIGVKYDVWFSEESLYKKGLVEKAIASLEKKGFTYRKEGALWFTSTKFGDDKDRVLIKADGEPTYFASDTAYHLDKVSRKYDLLVTGWGADHWGYAPRLRAAAKVFGFDQKLKIIIGQFVRLIRKNKEVRMSKRSGTFVTLAELIDEVGVDVARFFFLMKSIDTHIDFDLDLAKQQSEKNPVYYVQYAHARICSILRKLKVETTILPPRSAAPSVRALRGKLKVSDKNLKLLNHPSELALMKQLIRLSEIIEDTAKDYQVQRLPQYAINLATSFHQFYRDCRVISDDKTLTQVRLSLILAIKTVLKNTLDLMGVSAPERM